MKTVTITLTDGTVIEGIVTSEEDSELVLKDTTNGLPFYIETTVED